VVRERGKSGGRGRVGGDEIGRAEEGKGRGKE